MAWDGQLDVKEMIKRHLLKGACKMDYEPPELHALLDKAEVELMKQSALVEVSAPVTICGDVHGQYRDLFRIFQACGWPHQTRYLFLGDYIDRGAHSLEVITLLLACKVQFPTGVYLLRGNHEIMSINRSYGFYAELRRRYRFNEESQQLYNHFNEVFDAMPIAGLVERRILCMHGGLSPELRNLDDIRSIERPVRVPKGLALDLMWADPELRVKGFQANAVRGISHVFGRDVVLDTCERLGLDMVIRAHQVVDKGYAFFANRKLLTVFSAPRYHEDLLNYAATVSIDRNLQLRITQLKPQEYDAEMGGQ